MKLNLSKSISSHNRLEETLQEIEDELESLQPEIEKLEKGLEKLRELKLTKQKLITLKLSIKSILDNFSQDKTARQIPEMMGMDLSDVLGQRALAKPSSTSETGIDTSKTFLPDLAFDEANTILKQKNSLNYEIFRAIVFNGGRASTEQIKQYLVENNITQPTTGESFENVELTDISSRVNYLVRKGVVSAAGKGLFISSMGWRENSDEWDATL